MKDKVNGQYTDSQDSGKYGLTTGGLLLTNQGVSSTTNGISISPNTYRDFTITLPAETIQRLSNVVAPQGQYSYGHPYNIVFYSYGIIMNGSELDYQGHIGGAFESGFLDNNPSGCTLNNGDLHVATLKSYITQTDKGYSITYP